MEVKYGKGKTEYGPGVEIKLTGDEVATAIDAYLVSHGIHVNGELCEKGEVYVDPSGYVVDEGVKIDGRGPKAKYKDGDIVYCTIIPNKTSKILGEPQWNGYTYMYALVGTDLRCAEKYLNETHYIKS